MGWNDSLDPDSYDPADPDSLALAAVGVILNAAAEAPAPAPEEDGERGDCWDCGSVNVRLYGGKALCAYCRVLDQY